MSTTKERKEITKEMLDILIGNSPATVNIVNNIMLLNAPSSETIVFKLIECDIVNSKLFNLAVHVCRQNYELMQYLCATVPNTVLSDACSDPVIGRKDLHSFIDSFEQYNQFEVSKTTEAEVMTPEAIKSALATILIKTVGPGNLKSMNLINSSKTISSYNVVFSKSTCVIDYNHFDNTLLFKDISLF